MHHAKRKFKIFSFRTILVFITALILGFSLYNFNAQKLLGNKLPMPFGYGVSVVLSGSMEPTLKIDELVIVKETKNIEVNDVIVFQDGDSLVIHRVIEMKDDGLIVTKGDANNAADEPIDIKNVKGVMVAHIPFVGLIINFLKQPVVVIILLILVFLLTETSFRKEKSKDIDEIEAIKLEIEKLTAENNQAEER